MWRVFLRKLYIVALLLLLSLLLLDGSLASAQERMYEISEAELTQPGGVLRVFADAVGEITLRGSVKRLRVGEIRVK